MKSIELPTRLGAPAERALSSAAIKTLNDLTRFTEKEIAKLHGIGNHAMIRLKDALRDAGLAFKQDEG